MEYGRNRGSLATCLEPWEKEREKPLAHNLVSIRILYERLKKKYLEQRTSHSHPTCTLNGVVTSRLGSFGRE